MAALPTLSAVLALPVVRRGAPEVVAGAEALDRPVRWAHVAEVVDIGSLLRGRELLLTTGMALPDDPAGLRAYVAGLVAADAAGVVVELGRRYVDALPPALVSAAREQGLPLVVLAHETRFVEITEAVHQLVADAQLFELRASEELHRAFTELAVEGADATTVVREAARLAHRPVVLENLTHQVLAYDAAGQSPADVLADWEARSRRVRCAGRTGRDPASGWVVSQVGARGTDWGRLVLVSDGSGGEHSAVPDVRDAMLLERAAEALALNRLLDRDRESLERQAHRVLLSAVLHHALPVEEIAVRAKALGVPLDRRHVVALVLLPEVAAEPSVILEEEALRDLAEAAAAAVREARLMALVAPVDDGVGVLISAASTARADAAVDELAERLRQGTPRPGVVGVGSVVSDLRELRRSVLEAVHVAEAAVREPGRQVHRLADVRLRGLLHLLRDDARLQTYVERELGPLLSWDAAHRSDLLGILRTYLGAGRNKSAAAAAAHLSRPAFYERLARLEQILGADLDDVESCLSLHVAVLAIDAVRSGMYPR
ncbi:MAG TPA: PucR family transcriptional regulator [Actinomycetes bacterium]|nr:PucR family transcriptional regulator [Actinomycetes bacterium]